MVYFFLNNLGDGMCSLKSFNNFERVYILCHQSTGFPYSSDAMMTVDVTPSPQAFSWLCASETKALAAGCFTRKPKQFLPHHWLLPSVQMIYTSFCLIHWAHMSDAKYFRKQWMRLIAGDCHYSYGCTAKVTGPRPEPSVFGGIMMTQIPSLQECCFQKEKIKPC